VQQICFIQIFLYLPPVWVNSPMASGWVYFWSHVTLHTLHKCLLQIIEHINMTLTTELQCFYCIACIQLLFTTLPVVWSWKICFPWNSIQLRLSGYYLLSERGTIPSYHIQNVQYSVIQILYYRSQTELTDWLCQLNVLHQIMKY
jgi:hypothetical protein